MRTGRGSVLVEPGKIEIREFALPDITADDALLRIEACGLCGTDTEQFDGLFPHSARHHPYPAIPGHEPMGLIDEIGEAASRRWGVRPGDRVAVRPFFGCGQCEACAAWDPVSCQGRGGTYGFIDVGKGCGLWGGFADYMYLHPLSVVRKIDASLAPEVAGMYNPLAAGVYWGMTAPETQPGDRVVILGPGVRGLMCLIAAKAAGAQQVIVTGLGKDRHKLALATQLGADEVLEVDDIDVVSELTERTGGGADVIVDTTPYATESVSHAVEVGARGARIILAGLKGSQATVAQLPSDRIVHNELRIRGVLQPPFSDFERAIEIIESRKHPLELMHTHSFDVDQASLAIDTFAGRSSDEKPSIHVAVTPRC